MGWRRVAERILAIAGAVCLPGLALAAAACEDDGLERRCFDWPNPKPCESGSAGTGSTDANAACPSEAEAGAYFCENSPEYLNGKKEDGQCCYDVNYGSGRPLRIDGAVHVATVKAHGGSIELPPDADAALWLRDGLAEHASIASFSRAALELMALGAPLELVEACHHAALDEARHARVCFAEARRRGAHVTPDRLEMGASLPLARTLEELVASTFREGCVGEAVASAILFERAAATEEPRLRSELLRMAEDEGRHAELGWRIVRWGCEAGGEGVARVLEDVASKVGEAPLDGFLAPARFREVERSVLRDVVGPAATACAQPVT
ncbi:MAG: ferritin-like domain-containing protein [Myxococcales bacterium]|nr:ferritin-like domain-containing protein [Myxococcales bacterium]